MYDFSMAVSVTLTKSPRDLSNLAAQFKALGDETRLDLVMTVASSENAEACVCDLTPETGLSQGTVSHHLKILVEAGLLDRAQRGKWAYYSLTTSAKKILAAHNVKTSSRKY
jgi:ArsR family transcriptional regulator